MRWFSLRSDGVSCHISQNHTSWRQLLDPIAICPPLCSQGCWQMLGISITDLQTLSIQEEHTSAEQVLGPLSLLCGLIGCMSTWDVCLMVCGFLWMGWGCLSADAGMKCFCCGHGTLFFWNERLVGEIFCLIQSRYCWWKKSQTTTWDGEDPVNNGINYQPQLVTVAGFQPSAVCQMVKPLGSEAW